MVNVFYSILPFLYQYESVKRENSTLEHEKSLAYHLWSTSRSQQVSDNLTVRRKRLGRHHDQEG